MKNKAFGYCNPYDQENYCYKDDKMKKLANFYSCYDDKYDAKLREFVRIESSEGYLLSSGKYRQYKTKILPSDLPEWYVYGYFYKRHGYMSAKGIKDLAYRPQKHWNHMFKDDCLFITS